LKTIKRKKPLALSGFFFEAAVYFYQSLSSPFDKLPGNLN